MDKLFQFSAYAAGPGKSKTLKVSTSGGKNGTTSRAKTPRTASASSLSKAQESTTILDSDDDLPDADLNFLTGAPTRRRPHNSDEDEEGPPAKKVKQASTGPSPAQLKDIARATADLHDLPEDSLDHFATQSMPEQMIELRAFLTVMFKAMQEKEALSIVKDPDARACIRSRLVAIMTSPQVLSYKANDVPRAFIRAAESKPQKYCLTADVFASAPASQKLLEFARSVCTEWRSSTKAKLLGSLIPEPNGMFKYPLTDLARAILCNDVAKKVTWEMKLRAALLRTLSRGYALKFLPDVAAKLPPEPEEPVPNDIDGDGDGREDEAQEGAETEDHTSTDARSHDNATEQDSADDDKEQEIEEEGKGKGKEEEDDDDKTNDFWSCMDEGLGELRSRAEAASKVPGQTAPVEELMNIVLNANLQRDMATYCNSKGSVPRKRINAKNAASGISSKPASKAGSKTSKTGSKKASGPIDD